MDTKPRRAPPPNPPTPRAKNTKNRAWCSLERAWAGLPGARRRGFVSICGHRCPSVDSLPVTDVDGKRQQARELLGEIYGWFSEGLDTADLVDARTLLAALT